VVLGLAATLGMIVIALAVSMGLERLMSAPAPDEIDAVILPDSPSDNVAHITATLFYGTEDGQALVGLRREVPLAEGRLEQGRQILMLALTPPPSGYVSVIPRGTTLRAFYVTDRGDAFIDLSPQVSSAHPGGSFAELLTVSALVNDVTANLPAVHRVQILIDGKQVDTLAGHVDLRRPLTRDTSLIRSDR
jgi:spore germination protein GerM